MQTERGLHIRYEDTLTKVLAMKLIILKMNYFQIKKRNEIIGFPQKVVLPMVVTSLWEAECIEYIEQVLRARQLEISVLVNLLIDKEGRGIEAIRDNYEVLDDL